MCSSDLGRSTGLESKVAGAVNLALAIPGLVKAREDLLADGPPLAQETEAGR